MKGLSLWLFNISLGGGGKGGLLLAGQVVKFLGKVLVIINKQNEQQTLLHWKNNCKLALSFVLWFSLFRSEQDVAKAFFLSSSH